MTAAGPPGRLSLNGRDYRVEELLGKGKGGYSYLVEDGGGGRFVLKQIHHEPCDYYQFGDKLGSELRDYARLRALHIPMPRLLEVDEPAQRLLKEYIPGDTVLSHLLRGTAEPAWTDQVRELCRRLYPAGLNIDYFPTNFIPWQGTLYYIDYECNGYMEEWDFEHWGVLYWSRTPQLEEYLRTRS